MGTIGFFTPVSYGGVNKPLSRSFLEKVDDYFYLGGRKAYVLEVKDGKEKVLLGKAQSFTPVRDVLVNIAKVVSYLSLVIPLFMLLTKAILRAKHHFQVIDVTQPGKKDEGLEKTASKFQQQFSAIPSKEMNVDIDALGLDLEEKGRIRDVIDGKHQYRDVTLRDAVEDVIKEIKRLIQKRLQKDGEEPKKPEDLVVVIFLDTISRLSQYRDADFGNTFDCGLVPSSKWSPPARWIPRIVEALKEKGHIKIGLSFEPNSYQLSFLR